MSKPALFVSLLMLAAGCARAGSAGDGAPVGDGAAAGDGAGGNLDSSVQGSSDLAGICSDVVNDAPQIMEMNVAMSAPPATGGQIADGTYWVTAVTNFVGGGGTGGPTGSITQMTEITGNGRYRLTQQLKSGVDRESGAFTVNDKAITVQQDCPVSGPVPYVSFSSDGTVVTLYGAPDMTGTVHALTFTKQK